MSGSAIKLKCVFVFFLVFLTGCMAAQTVPKEISSTLERVGVITLGADELDQIYIGPTVFSNERELHDISEWKLDGEYENQLRVGLESLRLFEVIALDYRREAFLGVYDVNGPWDAPAFRKPKWSAIEKQLKDLASRESLDAVVMLLTDKFCYQEMCRRGIEVTTQKPLGMKAISWVGFGSFIVFIDGNTGKPIVTTRFGLHENIENDLSRTKLGNYSDEQLNKLKGILVNGPKDNWVPVLTKFFRVFEE